VRAHFVNENIGGHATMHRHLRAALAEHPEIEATFFELDRSNLTLRVAAVSLPVLGRLDLDLHLLRAGLSQSALVAREIGRLQPAPDVIHAYTQNSALLSVGHMRRIPTVVSTDVTNRQVAYLMPHRHPSRFTPLAVRAGDPFERRVYQAARRVVAHSEWAAEAIRGYGIAGEKIAVIPFGIAVPPAPARVARDGLPRILFVGSSLARKGGTRLLELWRRHLAEVSELVLVTHDRVEAEAGLEVRNDVRPGDGQIEEILAGADIYAMPSDVDAFGYSLLEAMSAELPVVALRRAAIPELVDEGTTGLLAEPGDDAGLVQALRELVGDPERRLAFGRAGRLRVLERFDARVTTAALVDLLVECAGA
jgi:alpha-maltose-1-phosphate synthase